MVYVSEGAKWRAYQFSDPFAAGSFYVCNKVSKFCCRPDCDARPDTNLKSEIKFVDSLSDAVNLGYVPCEHCDPMSGSSIDVQLLIGCVANVNEKIGFMAPLLDENEEKNNRAIKENIIENKRASEQVSRRCSAPSINYDGKFSKDFEATSLSKNDSDHYRLVDLACRHLALAAAVSIFQPQTPKGPRSPEEALSPGSNSKKRRRRGGVLGFKELAAKSKLSAWHFHRVFKSVTGLTPKTYGDKCWEYIKSYKESGKMTKFHQEFYTPVSSGSSSSIEPASIEDTTEPLTKKIKIESPINDSLVMPNQSNEITSFMSDDQKQRFQTPVSGFDFNQPLMNNNFNMFDQEESRVPTKAFSFPDLTKFAGNQTSNSSSVSSSNSAVPPSLFDHTHIDDVRNPGSNVQESPLLEEFFDDVGGNTLDPNPLNMNPMGSDMTLDNAQLNNINYSGNEFSNLGDFTDVQFQLNPLNQPLMTDTIDSQGIMGLSPEMLSTSNI
ncbi:uncharacterized protein PRCAT00004518001 [Priceomyces carsonii]|uniref:uncharacterized protein n=1 Tax=Priceomyces carsonii TaxID=28549 RepID=UPI002ED7BED1|nr:unnamed protein product [Priceomyces carsonii]